MSDKPVLTVSQLNMYAKSIIDSDKNLADVFVCGEISNLRNHYASGHIYFTLKDDVSLVPAVIFKRNASLLKFELYDGMKVTVHARASIYERDSKFQLYVNFIQPVGIGSLYMQFELLKSKLEKLGVFDSNIKKTIPPFPKKIAVLTSDTGSVIHDIMNISSRRFPICDIVLCPVAVQGENAVDSIVGMLKAADTSKQFDAIIIARGGGSFEDLMPFNSQELAMAIYYCKTPVISAVGHETDFTICDFASDLRAPTPSAAAELVFPDGRKLSEYFNQTEYTLYSLLKNRISNLKSEYRHISENPVLKDSSLIIRGHAEKFNQTRDRLFESYQNNIAGNKNRLAVEIGRLNDLSPLAVLSRGYSIAAKDGKTIKSSDELQKDDTVKIRFQKGSAVCRVTETE